MTSDRERKAQWALEQQVKEFTKRFGRPPRENESIWYDPDAPGDEPVPITEDKMKRLMIASFFEAGIPDRLIYVYQKTGLILNDEGYKLAAPETQIEWDDTMREFFAMTRQQRRVWQKELRKACATEIRGKSSSS